MAEQPLVSIIIPTYNRAHLIGETLDSVLAQTYTNWECIVVDDGSTDATDALMAKYCAKDSRIRYYHRPEEHLPGGNGARNYGFKMSKGEYIQWFDSDDLMHPHKIEIKIKFITKNNTEVLIAEHNENYNFKTLKNIESNYFFSKDFYIDFILGKRTAITNDVIVKRVVLSNLRFNEKIYKAQEYEFFSRVFNQEIKYCFIDAILSFHRESENSISNSNYLRKSNSLIYLSKLLQKNNPNQPLIVERAKRQGRKTYKYIAKKKEVVFIFKHYNFFRKSYNLKHHQFLIFVAYNLITGRGFDKMKI